MKSTKNFYLKKNHTNPHKKKDKKITFVKITQKHIKLK
jgi:hypothetical protein